eukprot:comp144182_c0_seq1/m.49263 comp144182_c0_seq1/g.49263  ORF comp144182_c0_seq1/g.49263 comp144182_c0_seq1/m.49263 type:complete len:154 (-) comp144182_c0_seq1:112-573(-)
MTSSGQNDVTTPEVPPSPTLEGGCFCGYVHYQTSSPPSFPHYCHCSICRKISGAPFVPWFVSEKTSFQFTRGEVRRFASSKEAQRGFCPKCGTHLTWEGIKYPDVVAFTVCSLDDPQQVKVNEHGHVESALAIPWGICFDGKPPSDAKAESDG